MKRNAIIVMKHQTTLNLVCPPTIVTNFVSSTSFSESESKINVKRSVYKQATPCPSHIIAPLIKAGYMGNVSSIAKPRFVGMEEVIDAPAKPVTKAIKR